MIFYEATGQYYQRIKKRTKHITKAVDYIVPLPRKMEHGEAKEYTDKYLRDLKIPGYNGIRLFVIDDNPLDRRTREQIIKIIEEEGLEIPNERIKHIKRKEHLINAVYNAIRERDEQSSNQPQHPKGSKGGKAKAPSSGNSTIKSSDGKDIELDMSLMHPTHLINLHEQEEEDV